MISKSKYFNEAFLIAPKALKKVKNNHVGQGLSFIFAYRS